jgi:hypothetical protein
VTGAVDEWNQATDSSGNGTYYHFVIDQNTSSPDIKVSKQAPTSGNLASTSSSFPYTIKLHPDNANLDLDDVTGRVAHEMGHTIGLVNADSQDCASIMNGRNADGSRDIPSLIRTGIDAQ